MTERPGKAVIAAVILLLALCSQAFAYQVSITAAASKDEVKKGEAFTYTLSIIEEGSPDKRAELVLPDFSGFAVSSSSSRASVQVARDKARKVTENVYRLSSDMPGEHTIPPATLVLADMRTGERQEIPSNEVKVTVLEEEQGVIGGIAGDIRDIKEPKTLLDTVKLYFYGFVAVVILALLILVGFAAYVARKKTRNRPLPAPPAGPGPREAALIELEKAALLRHDARAFYTATADALRRYLSAAHGINAMEATTSELVARARKASVASDKTGELESLFNRADMVKFAKHDPDEADKDAFMRDAVALVKGL